MTWNEVNELFDHKSIKSPLPLKLKTIAGDTVVEDPQVISEEFNNFFANIGKEMAGSIQTRESDISSKLFHEPYRTNNSKSFSSNTEIEVYKLLNEIKKKLKERTILHLDVLNQPIPLLLTLWVKYLISA